MANNKIRIRLKSFDHKILDASAEKIISSAKKSGAQVVGPVPLPTEKEVYTILRAVHKYKDSREQFEIRTHKRLIDIVNPTPETVDVFTTDGVLIPVTVVEATENVVLQKKTVATDGYDAVKVGFEDKREKLANKAEKGIANKANTAPKRFIKEFRYDEMMSYEVGDKITVDSFVAGEVVDVTGTSKGKGYQGVIKRHGQHIGPKGHGSGAHRIVGSMGPIAPNRIAPGKKLPGQMGHVTRTIQNLEVVAVDPENNLLLIKGSVPGPKKGLVVVKTAIKKAGQVNPVHELVDYTPEEVEETVVEEAVETAAAE